MKNLILVFGMGVLTLAGCQSNEDSGNDSSNFNMQELLNNYSQNVIQPNYDEVYANAEELKLAVSNFRNSPNDSTLQWVRSELFETQKSYQSCSFFDFGPAIDHSFRSVLNTYPTNTSIIEQNISNGVYNLNTAGNIAAKGLPAIEFLVYGNNKTDQEIIDLFTINSNASNRLAYLGDVVEQVYSTCFMVTSEWSSNGYATVFVNNNGTGVGSSLSLLLNAMVLDFERYIRDGKVGIPLGVRSLGVANPDKVEAYYSQNSLELLNKSILEYKNMFNVEGLGSENGVGFDDYLTAEGAGTTATSINTQLDMVLLKLNELPGPLSENVVSNKAKVQEVYDEMQKAIVLLKVEMPSALSVLVTYQDSDGD